ncbi:hypothetical protein [Falsiroseomonas sp. CW058]|uniref:hypothetical protein n=1 Tax=Falsiroseomonas sp. CW058 TaxID=3388664 RepID=UPI003D315BB8
MAHLSWQRGPTTGFTVAADIFPLTELTPHPRGVIEYEVLVTDAELLEAHVGTSHRFIVGDRVGPFLAKIGPLMQVTSTHAGLGLMRGEPTLRGRLEIIDPEAAT